VVLDRLLPEFPGVRDYGFDLVCVLPAAGDEGDVAFVHVVGSGHRDGEGAVPAVVCHDREEGEDLPARGGGARPALGCDRPGDPVALLSRGARPAEFRPVTRRAIAGPPAFRLPAGGRDSGDHVVARVPPVGVVLGRPYPPEPPVCIREKVVGDREFFAGVVLRRVVLDPVDQVVGRLINVVGGPQRGFGVGLLDHRIEEIEDPGRAVPVAGHHVGLGQYLRPLGQGLEVVDRRAQVAGVFLRQRLQRVVLVLDPLLAADVP